MLGNMILGTTDNYKYLGEVINFKRKTMEHVHQLARKTEGAYQAIIATGGDKTLRGIQMESIWSLIEKCIIPIVVYGCETWTLLKGEEKALNDILDDIIRRILFLPGGTPREVLYMETGLIDIKHQVMQHRIGMARRLDKSSNDLIEMFLDHQIEGSWTKETDKLKEKLLLVDEEHQCAQLVERERERERETVYFP